MGSSAIHTYKAKRTSDAKTHLRISLYQLRDSLEKIPELAASLQDKYIEAEGSLLTMGPQQGGGGYLYFIATQQTDTSFEVAYPLDYKTILQSHEWSTCDSAILDYQKAFNLQEAAVQLKAYTELVNSFSEKNETVTFCTTCGHYPVPTTKREDYFLQNFCYETVRIKARVDEIEKNESGYKVSLENGALMSKTRTEKKLYRPSVLYVDGWLRKQNSYQYRNNNYNE